MTVYVANHQKKLRILQKREQELAHAIKHDYSDEKLEKAVEKVSAAKLNVFKALFAKNSTLPPHSYTPNKEAQKWQSMTVAEILEKHRSQRLTV